MSASVRKQIVASGRVQGVNYRWFVLQSATHLGLMGWVRNLSDGRVEAEVEGDPAGIDKLIAAMREGPRGARVTDLEINDLGYLGQYDDFQVR